MPPKITAKRAPVGWMVLAFVTCPCHLPLVSVALAGSVSGAWLAENLALALGATVALFVLALVGLWRRLAVAPDPSSAHVGRSSEACRGVLPPPAKR